MKDILPLVLETFAKRFTRANWNAYRKRLKSPSSWNREYELGLIAPVSPKKGRGVSTRLSLWTLFQLGGRVAVKEKESGAIAVLNPSSPSHSSGACSGVGRRISTLVLHRIRCAARNWAVYSLLLPQQRPPRTPNPFRRRRSSCPRRRAPTLSTSPTRRRSPPALKPPRSPRGLFQNRCYRGWSQQPRGFPSRLLPLVRVRYVRPMMPFWCNFRCLNL